MFKALLLSVLIGTQEMEKLEHQTAQEVKTVEYRKVCPYGSVSFFNVGAGVSLRDRTDFAGHAFDARTGIVVVPFINSYTASLDYNWFKFHWATANSPYFSYGIGGVVIINGNQTGAFLCVPLRVGYQFQYGFIDIGAKLVPLPLPEVRAGLSVPF